MKTLVERLEGDVVARGGPIGQIEHRIDLPMPGDNGASVRRAFASQGQQRAAITEIPAPAPFRRQEPAAVPEFRPEENPFSTVVIDITHRCNMSCANCYLPNRSIADLSVEAVLSVARRFPRRTNIRIAGAEPTLHSGLFDLIAGLRKAGHRATLLTNGLRLARADYVARLKAVGLRHVYISMNGADRDDWYLALDSLACADKKLAALDNALAAGMIVNTGTILVPGLNDYAPRRLYDRLQARTPRTALMRFKNVGALGRHMNGGTPRYDFRALVTHVAEQLGVDPARAWASDLIEGRREPLTRFFPVDPASGIGSGIWVKVTGWDTGQEGTIDAGSQRRGRLTQNMTVAPFFEHVAANEGGY